MSQASLLREPNGGTCVVAHASSLVDFGVLTALTTVLPETVGLVVFPPPDQFSPHRRMDSLVMDQADQLCELIPASTSVSLVGDCLAGHITLNMAQQLISRDLMIGKLVLLDTTPLKSDFETGALEILTLPGDAEGYGSLGSRLLELDEQRKASEISLETWAAEVFDAVSNQRNLVAEGLQEPLDLTLADAEEIAECVVGWTRFAGIILTSSPVKYAGPVTLLASPGLQELAILEAWAPTLPKIEVKDAKIGHFEITKSPVIAEALTCTQ